MGVTNRVQKKLTRRGKKFLENREPKLVENAKRLLVLRGNKAGDVVLTCLKDLVALKRPLATFLDRKRQLLPFEDITPIEQLASKADCSLFAFGSHSKKRPQNLVLGRLFDQSLLDMVELGVRDARSLANFRNAKVSAGTKPCLLFAGERFTSDETHVRLKSLLIDLFRGEQVAALRLGGFEHALAFTATDDCVYMRSYKMTLQRAGGVSPRVELTEIGPRLELTVRRSRLASDDLFRRALKQPKQLKTTKVKNISDGKLGAQMGRIHMETQNFSKLTTKKMKGLKPSKEERRASSGAGEVKK